MPDYLFGTAISTAFLLFLTAVFASSTARAGEPASFQDFKFGQTVLVEGTSSGTRDIAATKIEIQRRFKLEGEIQAIDGGTYSLIIVGVKIAAVPDVEIEDPEGIPIEFTALRIGQTVKVKGSVGPDGAFEAKKIELQMTKYALEGQIQAIDANSLTVIGVRNLAGFDSIVEETDGTPIDFFTLRTRQMVKIKGNVRPDGRFEATRIKLRKPSGGAAMEGVVEMIDTAKNTLTVMGVTVRVDTGTDIEFR